MSDAILQFDPPSAAGLLGAVPPPVITAPSVPGNPTNVFNLLGAANDAAHDAAHNASSALTAAHAAGLAGAGLAACGALAAMNAAQAAGLGNFT